MLGTEKQRTWTASRGLEAELAAVVIGILTIAWVGATPQTASACMHGPSGTEVGIEQTGQRAIVYHRNGREDLVLSAGIRADGELPKLGWVLPVPAEPDDYGTANPELIDNLEERLRLTAKRGERPPELRKKGATKGGDRREPGLQELEAVETGPYDITPLKASGREGARQLRSWLGEREFTNIPMDRLEYYVTRGWMFLAVSIQPSGDQEGISDGDLAPLHLSFPSERAVYPLKLEAGQGVFPVTLYLLTDEPVVPEELRGAMARGFYVAGARTVYDDPGYVSFSVPDLHSNLSPPLLGAVALPSLDALVRHRDHDLPLSHYTVHHNRLTSETMPEGLEQLVGPGDPDEPDSAGPYVRVLHSPSFNTGFAQPEQWEEELAIPGTSSDERLEGELPARKTWEETESWGCASPGSGAEQPVGVPAFVLLGLIVAGRGSTRRSSRAA